MGWKDWVYGDLVSAADFQSLVQDQTVQRYASSAARSAALGSAVAEGMVSYLDDSNSVEVYTGSGWDVVGGTGRNAIINGAFDIWQRGTSFTPAIGQYLADRWKLQSVNAYPTSYSITQQTFTPGSAPATGYEGTYYLRSTITTVGATNSYQISQLIEDVRTFAGQTVTFSFWAKADSARTLQIYAIQDFGTGGSGAVVLNLPASATITLSNGWTRYSITTTIPSITGKTIGTGSNLNWIFSQATASGSVLDIWGVQLEAGSSATPFKRNAPSIQGELAACQRYYQRFPTAGPYGFFGLTTAHSTAEAMLVLNTGVQMRNAPTSVESSGLGLTADNATIISVSTVSIPSNKATGATLVASLAATGLTQFRPYIIVANNNANAYLAFSSEL